MPKFNFKIFKVFPHFVGLSLSWSATRVTISIQCYYLIYKVPFCLSNIKFAQKQIKFSKFEGKDCSLNLK